MIFNILNKWVLDSRPFYARSYTVYGERCRLFVTLEIWKGGIASETVFIIHESMTDFVPVVQFIKDSHDKINMPYGPYLSSL